MRRRLDLDPTGQTLACIAAWIFGIGIGIGGSYVYPWGFAPEPPALEPRRAWQPKPGEVLTAGPQSALVHSELIADMGDGARLALVIWIRGRSGREPVKVSGCGGIGGAVESLDTPRRREAWTATGSGIFDLIGRAACHGINPSPTPAPSRAHHLELRA
jgi:hypothetical protein